MIWITSLCLIVLATWLILNALNERRWVEDHSHDETVASDEGIFDSAVQRVQQKTASFGEKFIETKASEARLGDDETKPKSVREENSMFGRAVARIGSSVEKMDGKLDEKMKAAASQTRFLGDGSANNDEGLMSRASRKVSRSSDAISLRVANYARGVGRHASSEDGVFGKMVGKVSNTMQSSTSSSTGAEKEDFITRAASKIGKSMNKIDDKMSSAGNRINDLDEKIVSASKDSVAKIDK